MTDNNSWISCSYEYDPEKDAVVLYREDDKKEKEVMGILHRTVLIKMLRLLPGYPPSIYK